jgi:hypothetical protein
MLFEDGTSASGKGVGRSFLLDVFGSPHFTSMDLEADLSTTHALGFLAPDAVQSHN